MEGEHFQFCGCICLAAKKLRFLLMEEGDHFVWFDEVTWRKHICVGHSDRKLRLFCACTEFVSIISNK